MIVRTAAALCLCWSVGGLPSATHADNWRAATDRVDRLLADRWAEADIEPAPPATDAQFLRRAYLDLTGVIPTVGEVRRFLADDRHDKRARLIEHLLEKPNHATHLANVWREMMLPPTNTDIRRFGQTVVFDRWLRDHFVQRTPYDQMVRELLTASGELSQSGPVLYYVALELKPEELAASSSRTFLGMQIECAQCHDHPFDRWTQRDFWGYAAFFARLERPRRQRAGLLAVMDSNSGEVTLPDTDQVVLPRYLGGDPASAGSGLSRRVQLADWLTSPENPYFARATVNRVWSLLFGYGLVDPVDDFGDHNPPSHPRLLDELAVDFVDSGYDLRRVFRILANTEAYQRTSEVTEENQPDPRLFSRMAVKSLTPEQIYNCLSQAIGLREPVGRGGAGRAFGLGFDQQRQAFLSRFEAPAQRPTEFQAGIPQALTMMNGRLMSDATDLGESDVLAALTSSPFFTDEDRVEVLFLSTLARFPTPAERERFVGYVERGGPRNDSERALSDVLWALLNSSEFILNH